MTNRIRIILLLFACSFLSCNKEVLRMGAGKKMISKPYKISSAEQLPEDSDVAAMIAPYKSTIDQAMNVVIGHAAIDLDKQKPQSLLGNWVADLLLEKAEIYYGKTIDISAQNYGGLRIPTLPMGPITEGKIFELMPFDNMMVVLEVKGDIVQQFFDRMADYGGWPISKTVHYKIADGKAIDILIKGAPIQTEKKYTIAVSDFVANGGDNCFFFKNQERENLNVLVRDAMIEYVKDQTAIGEKLKATLDDRVIEK